VAGGVQHAELGAAVVSLPSGLLVIIAEAITKLESQLKAPSPGADVAGVSPVPAQMWQGRAQSRRRCSRSTPAPLQASCGHRHSVARLVLL
jgi:hypothetical protein